MKVKNPDLIPLWEELREILSNYSPPFSVLADELGRYELESKREVEIAGRLRKSVYFAAMIIQKNYVGFYFMPVYEDREKFLAKIGPELVKTLKGKNCFYIKKSDPIIFEQIKKALNLGVEYYKEKGWV